MATCCLSQTSAIFVLLAISKPLLRFRRSLYRFQEISSHLSSGTHGIPSWRQVHAFLVKSCICIAYRIPHSIPCLHHVVWALHVIDCVPFACCYCLGWAGRRVREWGARWVRLRGSRQLWVLCRQDDHTLEITSIFGLLDARSFAMPMLRCLPLAFKPPKLPCQTSNPPCPSKPLIGYVTTLLSPSYSVASCRWRLEIVPCWNIVYCWGITILYCLS